MGQHYRFIPAKQLDRIIELRRRGTSIMNIADELGISTHRVAKIIKAEKIKVVKKDLSSKTKKRRVDGYIATGVVRKKTRKKVRQLMFNKNIITDTILNDVVFKPYIRVYKTPLGVNIK